MKQLQTIHAFLHNSKLRQLLWWLLLICLLAPAALVWAMNPGAMTGATITVCPSGCDHTTIQAAVNAASDGDTLQLLNTSPHTESGITVSKDLVIVGQGAYITNAVQAAASPGIAPDLVFRIIGSRVELRDLMIRHGVATDGGGIYNDGGDLMLLRTIVSHNEGDNGGGIFNSHTGALELVESGVSDNQAEVGAGIYNAGTLSATLSHLFFNTNATSGGGLANSGTAMLENSTIGHNYANDPTSNVLHTGGGIYSSGTLHLIQSLILSNVAGGTISDAGGGIYSSGELVLDDSHVIENHSQSGGGMYLEAGNALIRGSNISQNGDLGNGIGGGVAATGATVLTIVDSSISDNTAASGGGLYIQASYADITNSTIHGNKVTLSGGGLVACSVVGLENATISGNDADVHGGGIFVCKDLGVSLANVTITANRADMDANGDGDGGGIYLDPTSVAAVAFLRNSILADNNDLSPGFLAIKAPDCYGDVYSQGYNLIGGLGLSPSGPPCSLGGELTGNLVGLDPMLELLAYNGGPTLTHALLPASPAVDSGDPAGCHDFDGNPLAADQRHALRIDGCDIGAYELGGLVEHQFIPAIRKP